MNILDLKIKDKFKTSSGEKMQIVKITKEEITFINLNNPKNVYNHSVNVNMIIIKI